MARQKQRFLEEFLKRGIVKDAARAVGINRSTMYKWRERDAAFAEAFRDADEEVGDLLEEESHKRAMGEIQVPVYYKGEVVGYIPRYSDKLLMLLLRARRPEKYREGWQHQVGNRDERPVFPLAALRALVDDDEWGEKDRDMESVPRAACCRFSGSPVRRVSRGAVATATVDETRGVP